jgi:hypothetical protein
VRAAPSDTFALDLDVSLVWFSSTPRTAELAATLRRVTGVVEIIETYTNGIQARLVFDGRQRREQLWRLVHELDPKAQWAHVRREDRSPADRTWEDLAVQAAIAQGWSRAPEGS